MAAVVLASPFVWSLVRMTWAAEPVGYVQQDGTVRMATIGPKSFWPDWALRPADARVEVESHFQQAGNMPAIGLAAVALKGEQRATVEKYESDLKSHGFIVTRYMAQFWSADIPSRRFVLCAVEGVQGATLQRTVRLSFSVDSNAMPTKLYWMEGEITPLVGMTPGPCFG
jgi:hypothetical protein